MITDFLVTTGLGFFQWILSLFPAGSGLSADFHTAASTLGSYLRLADQFVPIAPVLTVFGLVLTMQLLIFQLRVVRFVLSHIPILGAGFR